MINNVTLVGRLTKDPYRKWYCSSDFYPSRQTKFHESKRQSRSRFY